MVIAAVMVTGPLLVLGAGHDLQGISTVVMVGLGGAALALVARSFRSALPRVALRVSAVWVSPSSGTSPGHLGRTTD